MIRKGNVTIGLQTRFVPDYQALTAWDDAEQVRKR